jgi:hypothetical protein
MDSRKCQTTTASPAEPGELPFGLGSSKSRDIKFASRNDVALTNLLNLHCPIDPPRIAVIDKIAEALDECIAR